jgi:hypothetical protein
MILMLAKILGLGIETEQIKASRSPACRLGGQQCQTLALSRLHPRSLTDRVSPARTCHVATDRLSDQR